MAEWKSRLAEVEANAATVIQAAARGLRARGVFSAEKVAVINAQMGLMVGGGRKNIVANNKFIGCDVAIHVDNRGMGSESVMCNNATGASCKC